MNTFKIYPCTSVNYNILAVGEFRSNPEFWENKLEKLTNQPRFATACLLAI